MQYPPELHSITPLWEVSPYRNIAAREKMARTKKLKVQIKCQKVSLGWAYRIYSDGMYMGTGLTMASARDSSQRMLPNYDKARWRNASG